MIKVRHKFKIKKVNGQRIAVPNAKWQDPMKVRVPATKTFGSNANPSRAELKAQVRSEAYRYDF